jgi:hypothetical protein
LAGWQPAARKDGLGIEIVDAVAVLAAVIEQTALGAAKDARLLHAPLAAGTAQALGMEVTRDPPATLRVVQQVGNGKNHTEILSCAQILDMSREL